MTGSGNSEHLMVNELRFPRQLLLWALRQTWFAGGEGSVRQVIAESLQRVGLSQAHSHLELLVERLVVDSERLLQMLPPDRCWVSCDELLLLDMFGALQVCDEDAFAHFWRHWLPPTAARFAALHAAEIAGYFRSAGLMLGNPGEHMSSVRVRSASAVLH